MIYSLDSTVLITVLRARSPSLLARLRTLKHDEAGVSSVVKAELFFGCMKSQQPELGWRRVQETLAWFHTLPFDDECAVVYAKLRKTLESRSQIIGANDLMIAATALANDATLITHNTREFSRVDGLKVEDWESS